MDEELTSDLPTTDLPVYLATAYFRLADNKFFVPISLVVPGSEIPFTRGGDQDKATLDVIGAVLDDNKRPISFAARHRQVQRARRRRKFAARTCSTTAASCCPPASII